MSIRRDGLRESALKFRVIFEKVFFIVEVNNWPTHVRLSERWCRAFYVLFPQRSLLVSILRRKRCWLSFLVLPFHPIVVTKFV